MEEVSAKLCGVRLSAQKARLVVNLIRGKSVNRALEILNFTSKKAAKFINQTLKTVMYNAKNNKGMNIEKLIISAIWITDGKTFKRSLPRSKGRTDIIRNRTCHINIKVTELII
ncbi:LSU ribosomal protein L22p (L17e) [Candidatus Portiera aleyrodidarum BT-B-HRs]|uniref:50S ribosomal protein L22 n=1 Tax=Candidatus Portiera aleyrodidarum TaxID=91844 RepID=UPI00027B3068|nr:50S ribosomal protein L22 [Candidatus Portiera aleyrodidarum]AFQ24050.1 LSU ribosomal protein L22P [Candidatus Portiera aleyrodidarum BT-B-HRs]AFT80721.1 LSU ribosomal protein L22p (L17e) [Candidatus Portiera aleyrodidarum BT-B-HRs]ASX27149.1 50S ribosomal protein L22 [Candidatus Portiera aleyrodidarum MED (Bemisia tabaci)]